MLLVCCFCDQVRDESMGHGHWRELYGSMGSRPPKREETVLSYTCCDNCLQDSALHTRPFFQLRHDRGDRLRPNCDA